MTLQPLNSVPWRCKPWLIPNYALPSSHPLVHHLNSVYVHAGEALKQALQERATLLQGSQALIPEKAT